MICKTGARLIITTGTAGATFSDHQLGDVMVTTPARFRLSKEFRKEAFNHQTFTSGFTVPRGYLDTALSFMQATASKLTEPALGAPTTRYPLEALVPAPVNTPDIKLAGRDFAANLPMLTTDYFEYGTSTNGLETVSPAATGER